LTRSYQKRTKICELCDAECSGPLNYACALEDAPWTATHRSCAEYLETTLALETIPELVHLRGYHSHALYTEIGT